MHFAIQNDLLVKALKDVSSALATRVVQPILSNVLIESIDDVTIRFTATDLDLTIETKSPAVVYTKGKITLPGKKLVEVASKLPNELVTFQVNKDNLETTVTCHKSRFSLSGLDAEDFPKIADLREHEGLVMPSDILRRSIAQTVFAAASYESSSILGGVYLQVDNGVFQCTATDASRLANRQEVLKIAVPAGKVDGDKELEGKTSTATLEKPLSLKAIVPAKSCTELLKIVDAKEVKDVRIVLNNGQVSFETDSHYLCSRLINGEYPRYQELFPGEYKFLAVFKRQELLSAVDRVSVMSDDRTHLIKMSFDGEMVQISSNTPDVGRAHEEVGINFEGEPIEVALNVRYMQEVLQRLSSDEVRLEMTGALKPLIFKAVNDDNYRYLLMPVQSK